MSERVEPLGEKLKVDGDLLQWLGVGWRKLDDLIADHNRLAERVEGQGEELEAVRARLRMVEDRRTPSAEGEDHLLACHACGAKVGHLPGCPHHAPRHLLDLDAEARLRDAQREAFVAGAEWEAMMSGNAGRTRFYGQAEAEAARRWP